MQETNLDQRFAQGGDPELEEVVDAYGEKLLRYATSILGSYQDAEDMVQQVFLIAHQKRSSFDGGNLSAWLYKITYRHCLNHLKKRKFLFFADLGNVGDEAVDPFADSDLTEGIRDAWGQLSPKERSLLYCRILNEQSYDELSQVLGRSPAALRKQYERAKKKLASHLNTQGIYGKEPEHGYEQKPI